jgi:hypothetical protein
MSSYLLWRLDPSLSPVRPFPPVNRTGDETRETLERAALVSKQRLEGPGGGAICS